MDVVPLTLLGAGLIVFFGFFAEVLFKKIKIPDVLFLIALGFGLGPFGLNYVNPEALTQVAPIFTTFTLLFLLFDGAFNISLDSLLREFSHSFILTVFNFIISSALIMVVMLFAGYTWMISLLTGFLLGGVSSAFVIPVLNEMKIPQKLYSLLALESALTDVFCIVFSLTIIEIFSLGGFSGVQNTITQLVSLFAIGGLIGVVAGIVWIILIIKVFKQHNYMLTIAYLLLVYVLAEYLQGNGAIAALFFGLMLKNSKQLSSILQGILTREAKKKKKALKGDLGIKVTSRTEEFFYNQVSFILKTFFFVYIGLLIDFSDINALIIGGIISVIIMFGRMASSLLTKKMETPSKSLVNSIFARGLAAAAIAQVAIQAGVPHADFIAKVAYVVITGTIVLSSIRVFIVEKRSPEAFALPEE